LAIGFDLLQWLRLVVMGLMAGQMALGRWPQGGWMLWCVECM
jgi:hypothetical protein